MTLTNKQIEELKGDLLALKKRLESQAETENNANTNSDDVRFGDQHIADYATEYVDKQTEIAESHLQDEQLQAVDEALDRIDKGSYGICVDTGEDIPFERLKAIPYAKRTIEAEEKHTHPSPANKGEDATRLRNPDGQINDSRERTLDRIQEEHD